MAEHFLASRDTQELYHERYSCIGVMFASIPNYKEFYDESDVNKQGLECLRLLNEIICEFDKVSMRVSPMKKIIVVVAAFVEAKVQLHRKDKNDWKYVHVGVWIEAWKRRWWRGKFKLMILIQGLIRRIDKKCRNLLPTLRRRCFMDGENFLILKAI